LATCHQVGGALAEAESLLAGAATTARQLGNPVQAWHTLLVYGRVLHQLGREQEAAAAWSEALEGLRATGAALPSETRDTLFASSLGSTLHELSETS
jgi:hypothetical protein